MASTVDRRHAARVAGVATGIGTACFLLSVVALNFVLVGRTSAQVDARLHQELHAMTRTYGRGAAVVVPTQPVDRDDNEAPVFVWRVSPTGTVKALTAGSPRLASRHWTVGPTTTSMDSSSFRLVAARFGRGWLVAGESLADVQRLRDSLLAAESIVGSVLVIMMFAAAYVVGVRSLTPVAQARRRQAEFTADASHELRTPLSVIEAEVEIALSRKRSGADYEAALARIGAEGRRLRRIVEDLLWLARSDEVRRAPRSSETTDVARVAADCTSRFEVLGRSRDVEVVFERDGDGPALVRASDESLDRLVGVLVDNASKFAGPGGRVRVRVTSQGGRVSLIVDDSGPGIPEGDRERIFDRFHRTDAPSGGTGLGLAIADTIIEATGARCTIGRAELGGARFEVTWRRESPHTRPT